jgi:hypothetical protein
LRILGPLIVKISRPPLTLNQLYQHFMSSFSTKKIQTQAVRNEKRQKTISYEKAVSKLLVKLILKRLFPPKNESRRSLLPNRHQSSRSWVVGLEAAAPHHGGQVQFHQHAYMQLLHVQIPKAQKDSQVINVFFCFLDLHW